MKKITDEDVQLKLSAITARCEDFAKEILPLFRKDSHMTVLVTTPIKDADFIYTNDNLDEIILAIEAFKRQEQ